MSTKKKSLFSSLSYNYERIQTEKGFRPIPPPGHRNIMLIISFTGRGFCGYQYQPHGVTVQQVLTEAWFTLTKEQVLLMGCSRLDAQVSAAHFVLNFYSQSSLSCERIVQSLNGILYQENHLPIAIYKAVDMPSTFHARFDSIGKHYCYRIWYGKGQHAFLFPQCWQLRSRNPPQNLATILQEFTGMHDFAAFRAQDCQAKTTIRTIHKIRCTQDPLYPELVSIDFFGDGFLKNMIRNLVGTAMDISTSKLPFSTISDAFDHRNRHLTGQCAPAHGLVLQKVYYSQSEYDSAIKDP